MEAFRLQIPFAKSDYFPDGRTDERTDGRTHGQVSFERSKVQSASRNNATIGGWITEISKLPTEKFTHGIQ